MDKIYSNIRGRSNRLAAIKQCANRNEIARLMEKDLNISYLTARDYVDGIQFHIMRDHPAPQYKTQVCPEIDNIPHIGDNPQRCATCDNRNFIWVERKQ